MPNFGNIRFDPNDAITRNTLLQLLSGQGVYSDVARAMRDSRARVVVSPQSLFPDLLGQYIYDPRSRVHAIAYDPIYASAKYRGQPITVPQTMGHELTHALGQHTGLSRPGAIDELAAYSAAGPNAQIPFSFVLSELGSDETAARSKGRAMHEMYLAAAREMAAKPGKRFGWMQPSIFER